MILDHHLARMSLPIPVNTILTTAYGLLGDGQGQEWDLNPEYTRAITELVSDLVGVALDPTGMFDRGGDGWRPFVLEAIRKSTNQVSPKETKKGATS